LIRKVTRGCISEINFIEESLDTRSTDPSSAFVQVFHIFTYSRRGSKRVSLSEKDAQSRTHPGGKMAGWTWEGGRRSGISYNAACETLALHLCEDGSGFLFLYIFKTGAVSSFPSILLDISARLVHREMIHRTRIRGKSGQAFSKDRCRCRSIIGIEDAKESHDETQNVRHSHTRIMQHATRPPPLLGVAMQVKRLRKPGEEITKSPNAETPTVHSDASNEYIENAGVLRIFRPVTRSQRKYA